MIKNISELIQERQRLTDKVAEFGKQAEALRVKWRILSAERPQDPELQKLENSFDSVSKEGEKAREQELKVLDELTRCFDEMDKATSTISLPDKQQTLGSLRDTLTALISQGVPLDAPVITEGCDCYGDAGAVAFVDGGIIIKRVET